MAPPDETWDWGCGTWARIADAKDAKLGGESPPAAARRDRRDSRERRGKPRGKSKPRADPKAKTQAAAGGNGKTVQATTPAKTPAQLVTAPAPDATAQPNRRTLLENCPVEEWGPVRHPSGKCSRLGELETNFLDFSCNTDHLDQDL